MARAQLFGVRCRPRAFHSVFNAVLIPQKILYDLSCEEKNTLSIHSKRNSIVSIDESVPYTNLLFNRATMQNFAWRNSSFVWYISIVVLGIVISTTLYVRSAPLCVFLEDHAIRKSLRKY